MLLAFSSCEVDVSLCGVQNACQSSLEEKRGNTHILKNIEERGGNTNMQVCGSFRNIELLRGKAQHSAKPANLQSEIKEPCENIEASIFSFTLNCKFIKRNRQKKFNNTCRSACLNQHITALNLLEPDT